MQRTQTCAAFLVSLKAGQDRKDFPTHRLAAVSPCRLEHDWGCSWLSTVVSTCHPCCAPSLTARHSHEQHVYFGFAASLLLPAFHDRFLCLTCAEHTHILKCNLMCPFLVHLILLIDKLRMADETSRVLWSSVWQRHCCQAHRGMSACVQFVNKALRFPRL